MEHLVRKMFATKPEVMFGDLLAQLGAMENFVDFLECFVSELIVLEHHTLETLAPDVGPEDRLVVVHENRAFREDRLDKRVAKALVGAEIGARQAARIGIG